MMRSSIGKISSFYKERKCARKICIVFVTLSNLKKTSNRAVASTTPFIKFMKTDVSYYKGDMHVRPMRFVHSN